MNQLYSWIDQQNEHSTKKMVKALGVSQSGYYQWKKAEPSQRETQNQKLLEKIKSVFKEGRQKYGSPRITARLKQMGHSVNHKRVARIMRDNGIMARVPKRFVRTTNSKHEHPIAENHLDREFEVGAANQVWAGDISYLPTKTGWLYLSVILDLYSRKVIGWSMRRDLSSDLSIEALEMAWKHRGKPSEVMFHSDRGVQYAALDFRKKLKAYAFSQSMSRKGNCWDNACVESFFGSLKQEGCGKVFENQEEAKSAVFEYIEVFYNRQRLHSTLGYVSPEQFEQRCIA